MKAILIATAITTTIAASAVSAEEPEIIPINDGQLIVCSTHAATQTIYALVANGQMQNVDGCWVVDPPIEVIVLHDGPQISSITYREFTDEDEIARMEARGAPETMIERARSNPWSPWYQRPAWAFTAWLEPSE